MDQNMQASLDGLLCLTNSLQPSAADLKREQLEKSISIQLDQMAKMKEAGMDTSRMEDRIARLQRAYDEHVDGMIGL